MGAFVSLAFGWVGALDRDVPRLVAALQRAGMRPIHIGEVVEGGHESSWSAVLLGDDVVIACRCYNEGHWVSTTLDIDEERYEEIGNARGRQALAEEVVRLGARLFPSLALRYAFFDEEAEAEIDPARYRADVLFGITLVARDVVGLAEAIERTDVERHEVLDGVAVLYRRSDPVPHYEPPTAR